jgi:hypothetical protein
MQNAHKLFRLNTIIALIVFAALSLTALSLTGCDNGTTSPPAHVHQWGEWQVTTAPTYTTEGAETRTCILDATHIETRAISRTPFTSVVSFGTWLASQSANTVDTPYTIALNINDVADFATLFTTLNSAAGKYVYLDLSGSNVETIPYSAFYDTTTQTGCATLAGIIIPNSVTSIGNIAFSNCPSLVSVTIPNSVTSIGATAFSSCTSLTSVTIPASVTDIGYNPFSFCTSLAAITIAAGNTAYTADNGILYTKDKTTLVVYPAGKTGTSITIPNSITSIAVLAFGGCTSLASVTIPNSITGIKFITFNGCTSLASVTFQGTIASGEFNSNAFPNLGDLRAKFYATDPTNGTPGTYTTTAPVGESSVWTKK